MKGNEFFRNLHSFFATATHEKFEALWGRGMGTHLWMKWTGWDMDLVIFIGNLDNPNRELLYNFLTKKGQ
jgi:hypothetical protein